MQNHLLSITDLTPKDVEALLQSAASMKRQKTPPRLLAGKTVALIFEKPSTRTLISFASGIQSLGGFPLVLQSEALQWKRGEPIPDMARAMTRYVQAVMIRARKHADVEEFARYSTIPVINGLTDCEHPCQVLADIMTLWERNGRKLSNLRKLKIVFLGDSNNVSHSWLLASGLLGFHFVLACPAGYDPDPHLLVRSRQLADQAGGRLEILHDPQVAATNADVLYTDVWTSMGQESEESSRRLAFRPFQINLDLLKKSSPNVVVLHCLPARRGEEITSDVIDGPHSVVFDQAENRLHIQKAILAALMKKRKAG